MKAFFNELFDYNFYCNKKLIEECNRLENVPEKTIALFSHILNAHHVWNSRMLAKKREFEIFQTHPLTDWEEIHYDNQKDTFDIITRIDHFEKRLGYESTEGMPYTNTIQEMLFHIINHSTHHRAQISVDFRNNGIEPLALDYIYYKR